MNYFLLIYSLVSVVSFLTDLWMGTLELYLKASYRELFEKVKNTSSQAFGGGKWLTQTHNFRWSLGFKAGLYLWSLSIDF